jgi:hypothetical protein
MNLPIQKGSAWVVCWQEKHVPSVIALFSHIKTGEDRVGERKRKREERVEKGWEEREEYITKGKWIQHWLLQPSGQSRVKEE